MHTDCDVKNFCQCLRPTQNEKKQNDGKATKPKHLQPSRPVAELEQLAGVHLLVCSQQQSSPNTAATQYALFRRTPSYRSPSPASPAACKERCVRSVVSVPCARSLSFEVFASAPVAALAPHFASSSTSPTSAIDYVVSRPHDVARGSFDELDSSKRQAPPLSRSRVKQHIWSRQPAPYVGLAMQF